MPEYKQVTLKDPKTGDYLVPRVYGTLGYQVVNGEITPPIQPVSEIPSGIITLWSGSSDAVPSGWTLCDGQNGTPDLRDRFVVGAGSTYAVGDTGGSDTVTLTTNNLPSHNHTFSGNSHSHVITANDLTTSLSGSHTHTISGEITAGHVNFDGVSGNGTSPSTEKSYSPGQNGSFSTKGAPLPVYGASVSTLNIDSDGAHTHTISGSISCSTTTVSGTIGNTGSGQAHENRPPYYALCYIMKL